MKKIILCFFLCAYALNPARGQVLISLLLGDKLNSDKLSFGLDGGMALTDITNLPSSDMRPGFFLGFYFDFVLKNQWGLYTGVIVKSPMGAKGLTPYATGNATLDELLVRSSVERKLNYFNVPVLIKYKFPNYIFVEAGIQLGLLHKAVDKFSSGIDEGDILYTTNIRDQYNRIDFGLSAGVGYTLMEGKGIRLGIRYYGGLVNLRKDDPNTTHNSSLYFFAAIPIGGMKDTDTAKE